MNTSGGPPLDPSNLIISFISAPFACLGRLETHELALCQVLTWETLCGPRHDHLWVPASSHVTNSAFSYSWNFHISTPKPSPKLICGLTAMWMRNQNLCTPRTEGGFLGKCAIRLRHDSRTIPTRIRYASDTIPTRFHHDSDTKKRCVYEGDLPWMVGVPTTAWNSKFPLPFPFPSQAKIHNINNRKSTNLQKVHPPELVYPDSDFS